MISLADIKQANKQLREADESHLWPISGKFNATERAIRQVRAAMRDGMEFDSIGDYEMVVEDTISSIVNDERNW